MAADSKRGFVLSSHAPLRAVLQQAHGCLDAAAQTMNGDDDAFDEVIAARLLVAAALLLLDGESGINA